MRRCSENQCSVKNRQIHRRLMIILSQYFYLNYPIVKKCFYFLLLSSLLSRLMSLIYLHQLTYTYARSQISILILPLRVQCLTRTDRYPASRLYSKPSSKYCIVARITIITCIEWPSPLLPASPSHSLALLVPQNCTRVRPRRVNAC